MPVFWQILLHCDLSRCVFTEVSTTILNANLCFILSDILCYNGLTSILVLALSTVHTASILHQDRTSKTKTTSLLAYLVTEAFCFCTIVKKPFTMMLWCKQQNK